MSILIDRLRAALEGRYEIEREAGRGGMATVFRAADLRHDRAVAVKVLHPDLSAALGAERFLREVRITASISHPHVLPLLDSGEAEGLLYYVMPFVEGESLRSRLDREGPLPVRDAVSIAREVTEALGHAHARGIVHRDVKPENILLESGHARVADFGIARAVDEAGDQRLTAAGLSLGTPLYMSPEQAYGERQVDARSDLYAVGCILYEMLTGEPPFTGTTPQVIVARRIAQPVPSVRLSREAVPLELDAVIQRTLARTPGDRFQTAGDLVDALDAVRAASHSQGRAAPRRGLMVGVAALAFVALAGAYLMRAGGESILPEPALASIAVLPFVNVGSDADQEYFAEGLADELISSLSRVEGFQVASHTSSFAFRGSELDVREIGRRLSVGSVLEGSVRRGGGGTRVSVRLVSVEDGYQRWSRSYDHDALDALTIQEDIARDVVETLKGELGATDLSVVARPTSSPEAHDLYLRALALARSGIEVNYRSAISLLEEAVRLDPEFARAHYQLAIDYAVMGWNDFDRPSVVFPRAAEAARAALRADPGLGRAHNVIGYVELYYEWDVVRSEASFRRAISLEPNHGMAHQWYANLLTVVQRFDEAEAAILQTQVLDPTRVMPHAVLGWLYHKERDFGGAIRELERTLARTTEDPTVYLWYGQALESAGRLDEAVQALERSAILGDSGAIYVAALARAHALRGENETAGRLMAHVERSRTVPAYEVAKIHLALDDRASAIDWLERAFRDRTHSMVFLRVDPQLDPLRGEPAFEDLVRRVGV
jgi:eukaryotic-like serine/threonine-protein kinase